MVKTNATAAQKEYFKDRFAEIVKNNADLRGKYTVQFFETLQKSNYGFTGKDGKSLNILPKLTVQETEKYRLLKGTWQQ